MVCAFGNFIDNIGEWDILGDSKCLIQYDKCDRQVLDGWSMVRFFVFMFIGYSNPHAHAPIFTLSTFVELYSYSSKCSSKFILNPIVNMSGYTIGSALCQGDCMS